MRPTLSVRDAITVFIVGPHVAVPHQNNVDYAHDGHRHVAHDGRWDDH